MAARSIDHAEVAEAVLAAGKHLFLEKPGATSLAGHERLSAPDDVVVVLGQVGRNFGAGMSNGLAYVLDEAGTFASRCNFDMVDARPLDEADADVVRALVREHLDKTGSPRAAAVLQDWERFRPLFQKVVPHTAPAPAPAAPPPAPTEIPTERVRP